MTAFLNEWHPINMSAASVLIYFGRILRLDLELFLGASYGNFLFYVYCYPLYEGLVPGKKIPPCLLQVRGETLRFYYYYYLGIICQFYGEFYVWTQNFFWVRRMEIFFLCLLLPIISRSRTRKKMFPPPHTGIWGDFTLLLFVMYSGLRIFLQIKFFFSFYFILSLLLPIISWSRTRKTNSPPPRTGMWGDFTVLLIIYIT